MLSVASIFLLNIGLALSIPTVQEYRYITAGKELRRPTYLRPVTFNGVAIGTTELNSTGIPGTIHSLSDGHHFYQSGWYLSHTDTDEPVWMYFPDRRNQSYSQPVKRQSEDGYIQVYTEANSSPYISGAIVDFADTFEPLSFTIHDLSWSTSGVGEMFMDVFDNGAFVASSSALIGDLSNIFMNAFDIFL